MVTGVSAFTSAIGRRFRRAFKSDLKKAAGVPLDKAPIPKSSEDGGSAPKALVRKNPTFSSAERLSGRDLSASAFTNALAAETSELKSRCIIAEQLSDAVIRLNNVADRFTDYDEASDIAKDAVQYLVALRDLVSPRAGVTRGSAIPRLTGENLAEIQQCVQNACLPSSPVSEMFQEVIGVVADWAGKLERPLMDRQSGLRSEHSGSSADINLDPVSVTPSPRSERSVKSTRRSESASGRDAELASEKSVSSVPSARGSRTAEVETASGKASSEALTIATTKPEFASPEAAVKQARDLHKMACEQLAGIYPYSPDFKYGHAYNELDATLLLLDEWLGSAGAIAADLRHANALCSAAQAAFDASRQLRERVELQHIRSRLQPENRAEVDPKEAKVLAKRKKQLVEGHDAAVKTCYTSSDLTLAWTLSSSTGALRKQKSRAIVELVKALDEERELLGDNGPATHKETDTLRIAQRAHLCAHEAFFHFNPKDRFGVAPPLPFLRLRTPLQEEIEAVRDELVSMKFSGERRPRDLDSRRWVLLRELFALTSQISGQAGLTNFVLRGTQLSELRKLKESVVELALERHALTQTTFGEEPKEDWIEDYWKMHLRPREEVINPVPKVSADLRSESATGPGEAEHPSSSIESWESLLRQIDALE